MAERVTTSVHPVSTVVERRHRGKGRKSMAKDSDSSSESDPELEAQWRSIVETDQASRYNPSELPDLLEWDPRKIVDFFFMVLEGKRRTGKSTFAKWFLQYHADDFALAWCMTNTSASGYWQEFVGEAFTFRGWNPSAVWKIVQRNDAIIRQYGYDSPTTKKLANTLIVLDDVVSSKIHDDPMFKLLATEGRHHKISIILSIQDPKAINPVVRDNCDVAVIFTQKSFRNKESIWHDFMNDTTKDLAVAMMTRHTVDHGALVSVQTRLDNRIDKTFYKSTGDKTKLFLPDFRLGGETQKGMIEKERENKKKEKAGMKAKSSGAKEKRDEIEKLTAKQILRR